MRINQVGFAIDCDWQKMLTREVFEFCNRTDTPYWLMIAGPHGEFELLFTISPAGENEFLAQADSEGIHPIRLGRVESTPAVLLVQRSGQRVHVDVAALRNLLYTVGGDMQRYLEEFMSFGRKWGLD